MNSRLTAAERRYITRVVSLGCYLCRVRGYGFVEAEPHHLREGAGMGRKNSNYLTLPLCRRHHTDTKDGWHGDRIEWILAGVTEIDALADTINELDRRAYD